MHVAVRSARVLCAGTGSVAIALGVLFATPGPARAATAKRPVVLSLKVTHSRTVLPASGLAVKVTVRVRYAKRCIFFRQKKATGPLKPFKRVSCERGGASVLMPAVPNPSQSQVRLTFAVRALGAGRKSALRKVRLTEAGAPPPPPTASLTASTPTLPWTGGDITVTYSSTNATSCALTASPALWTGSNPLPVPCNGSTPVTVPGSLSAGQWSVTFSASGPSGQTTASTTLTRQPPSYSPSSNWSGYVESSNSIVYEVSGRFTVPTLDCSKTPNASISTWVGIGGVHAPDDLLQTGVESDCSGGVQVDDPAWWEEYPEVYAVTFDSMSVSPGDQIDASVGKQSDGTWVTRVDDLSTGISGVMTMSSGGYVEFGTRLDSNPNSWHVQEGYGTGFYFAGGYTAEWIVEDFDECSGGSCTPAPFADFGKVTFSDLSVDSSSPDPMSAEPVGLVQNSVPLSLPTPLTSSGFSILYTG
jgi:Peptidase A4 family